MGPATRLPLIPRSSTLSTLPLLRTTPRPGQVASGSYDGEDSFVATQRLLSVGLAGTYVPWDRYSGPERHPAPTKALNRPFLFLPRTTHGVEHREKEFGCTSASFHRDRLHLGCSRYLSGVLFQCLFSLLSVPPRLHSFFSSPSHHLSHPNRRSLQATPPLIPSDPLREATYYPGTHMVHGTKWRLPTRLTASQTRSGEHRHIGQPFQVPNLLPTAVPAGHGSSGQKNGWHQTTTRRPSASHRRLQA